MIQIVPTNAHLLRYQQELPEPLRQNHILLKFAGPIRADACGQFVRVRLTPLMQQAGESDFYLPHIFQPHRMKEPSCAMPRVDDNGRPRRCGARMRRVSIYGWQCTDPTCRAPNGTPAAQIIQEHGPAQGVIRVLTFPDWVVESRPSPVGPVEFVIACLLQLDRRYSDQVLAGLTRTAMQLAEENGWKLLN